jgi:hypothetical protein
MRHLLMSLVAAAIVTIGVHAQTPQTQANTDQTVTVTGCVQHETDVLKRPAVQGNVGMGDEFVLTHSTIQTGAAAAEPQPSTAPAPAEPTGTSAASPGRVYRVTGDQEASLAQHLGHRVQITGTFKSDVDARRELGAIGTSGKPPETAGQPTTANTPEIKIESVKMLSGTCGG